MTLFQPLLTLLACSASTGPDMQGVSSVLMRRAIRICRSSGCNRASRANREPRDPLACFLVCTDQYESWRARATARAGLALPVYKGFARLRLAACRLIGRLRLALRTVR
jgi:hypothetical protein